MMHPNRGSILVTILFMTSILALLVATIASDSIQSMRTVAQSGRDTQAKYAAYAGLEATLNFLRQEEKYHGDDEFTAKTGVLKKKLDGLEHLEFEVSIWNNFRTRDENGSLREEDNSLLEGPDDIMVSPDTVYMVSAGMDTERGETVVLSSMAGTARRVRPVFEDAAFARSKLALSGSESLVDAWDSHGGQNPYIPDTFPGELAPSGNTGGGHGNNPPSPTVENYAATLGTDSSSGFSMLLREGARLNGHYRVGPGVTEDEAFDLYLPSLARATASNYGGGDDSGSAPVTVGGLPVATADDLLQIAGVNTNDSPDGQGPSTELGILNDKFVVDTKETEVPRFISPYSSEDVVPGPTLNNPEIKVVDHNNKPVKDAHGNQLVLPPEPVALEPGGYKSIEVPKGQTLQLSSGVYFFSEELKVDGGKITTSGNSPAIVFVGKKATFINADVNSSGSASSLQLCFTDENDDPDERKKIDAALQDIMKFPTTAPGESTDLSDDRLDRLTKRDPDDEGYSYLEVRGKSQVNGTIAGENLIALINNSDIYGGIMGDIISAKNSGIHQDLALKGSRLMTAGGWKLEGVHQIR